jgi:hypothetical protein
VTCFYFDPPPSVFSRQAGFFFKQQSLLLLSQQRIFYFDFFPMRFYCGLTTFELQFRLLQKLFVSLELLCFSTPPLFSLFEPLTLLFLKLAQNFYVGRHLALSLSPRLRFRHSFSANSFKGRKVLLLFVGIAAHFRLETFSF